MIEVRMLVDERKLEAKIAKGVQRAVKALAPDIVRIRFTIEEDWYGVPCVEFRVLMSDKAGEVPRLHATAKRAAGRLTREVDPGALGLQPYFRYRTVSEQKELEEAAWE
ncbi:MAG: hypothetical protein FJW39_32675 [Acidobacteria bacterium]|nr:hypothetical protein [Acidobacteriota bacterium]